MVEAARLTAQEAEAFLYREARLLDERRYDDWLALFAADARYWLPIADDSDPETEPSILYDDREQMTQRVYQLLHTPHYAQLPASRTIHLVSNVEVADAGQGGEVEVRCNVLVLELRPGDRQQAGIGQQRTFAARCLYRLRREGEWRIALKKVLLLDHDQPIQNLTFIF